MPLRFAARRILPATLFVALAGSLGACTSNLGLDLTHERVQGHAISEDALAQVRPGQSQELVTYVLGSPQITNAFGDEIAWYYIETRMSQTAFGLNTIESRKVLAIYFDKNKRVADRAIYGLQDGRVIDIESRRTPSFGEDRTFIQSILASVTQG